MRQILSTYGNPSLSLSLSLFIPLEGGTCMLNVSDLVEIPKEDTYVMNTNTYAEQRDDNVSGLMFPVSPSCATTLRPACLSAPVPASSWQNFRRCCCKCVWALGRTGVAQGGACAAGVTPAEVPPRLLHFVCCKLLLLPLQVQFA